MDNSAVHPESYYVVEAMAAKVNSTIPELIKNGEIRKQLKAKDFVTEIIGEFTISDILKELEKPGRDPRAAIEEFKFADGINSMADLKPGMKVPAIITNITNFGAFANVGVKQDGMIHVSQMANRYISDPKEVVKLGQKVMVTVVEVDIPRKRIALSLKESGTARQEAVKKAFKDKVEVKDGEKKMPFNAFQTKLMELKKNFKE